MLTELINKVNKKHKILYLNQLIEKSLILLWKKVSMNQFYFHIFIAVNNKHKTKNQKIGLNWFKNWFGVNQFWVELVFCELVFCELVFLNWF